MSQVHEMSRFRLCVLLVGLMVGLLVVAVALGALVMDYLQTRSEARVAMTLARLGPGTPLDDYIAEFGQPAHHYTEPNVMKSWGPSTDEALLSKTELYYFTFSGAVPCKYLVVYIDRATRRSVVVTWKGM